jgi:hypothetical protein
MVTYSMWMLHTETNQDCNKATALVDWIYWYVTLSPRAFDMCDGSPPLPLLQDADGRCSESDSHQVRTAIASGSADGDLWGLTRV